MKTTLRTKSFDHAFNSTTVISKAAETCNAIGRISPSPFAYSGHAFSTPLDGPMLLSPHHITCTGSRTQQLVRHADASGPNLAKRSLHRPASTFFYCSTYQISRGHNLCSGAPPIHHTRCCTLTFLTHCVAARPLEPL